MDYSNYGGGRPMTKKEFRKHESMKKCTGNIYVAAGILYVCAVITAVVNMLAQNYLGFLDVAILVGLGLGIQIGQSRICAILVCAYAGLNAYVTIAQSGRMGGTLVVLAAVDALIATFQFQGAWKKYQKTGILP